MSTRMLRIVDDMSSPLSPALRDVFTRGRHYSMQLMFLSPAPPRVPYEFGPARKRGIRNNVECTFVTRSRYSPRAEWAMEMRLSASLIPTDSTLRQPRLQVAIVVTTPSVREWGSHWNLRLKRMLDEAEPCAICFEPLLPHDMCRPCGQCGKSEVHVACRLRCGLQCPLCRFVSWGRGAVNQDVNFLDLWDAATD